MKSLILLAILLTSTQSFAQEVTMLLGRGIETFSKDGATSMKKYNKIAEKIGSANRYTEAQIAEEKGKVHHLILSLECIGKSSQNDLNCYKVQPTVFDADQQKIVERGKVLLIGDFDPKNKTAQPSESEIKSFFKTFQQSYRAFRKTDFIAHRSEMIDVSGWGWSTDPVTVGANSFDRFRYFIMTYNGPNFFVPQISDNPMIVKFVDDYNAAEKAKRDAIQAQLIAQPYPKL